jgi:hypothetical protein
MDKLQLTKELLELVDASPLAEVDTAPLLEKRIAGMEIEEQRSVRCAFLDTLRNLKKHGEIDFYEGGAPITLTRQGQFINNSIKIKSTYQRLKEMEAKKDKNDSAHTYNIGGDVVGSILGSQSLEAARISPTIHTTKNTPNKNAKIKSLLEYAAWVAGIVGTLLLIYELFIK